MFATPANDGFHPMIHGLASADPATTPALLQTLETGIKSIGAAVGVDVSQINWVLVGLDVVWPVIQTIPAGPVAALIVGINAIRQHRTEIFPGADPAASNVAIDAALPAPV